MLEQLIKDLDNRGLLVLQVLLGKRAMELLEEKPKSALNKSNILRVTKEI